MFLPFLPCCFPLTEQPLSWSNTSRYTATQYSTTDMIENAIDHAHVLSFRPEAAPQPNDLANIPMPICMHSAETRQ